MSGELDEMKESHRAVEEEMDGLIELVSAVEESGTLKAEDRRRLDEQTEEVAVRLVEHLSAQEEAERVIERLFGEEADKTSELEDIDRKVHQVSRGLEEFIGVVAAIDEEIGTDDERWRRVRANFGELVETLRRCSQREWEFFASYSSLLEPGGLSS